MTACLLTLVLSAAALGAGATILRLFHILPDLSPAERCTWSFGLGFGVLGWLIFPLGIAMLWTPKIMWSVVVTAMSGLWFLRSAFTGLRAQRPSRTVLVLLGALLLLAFGDFLEAVAPPADADSMAYHFFLPKLFLQGQGIHFIPRAVDGAAPLLPQMTYALALGLGDELALTLWCFVTGWGAAAILYSVARRYVSIEWALAAAILYQSTPAILYGAGTGQVEGRIAMFALVAAVCVADLWRTRRLGFAAIAGVAAGFYAASKYPGLLFAVISGVAVILASGRILAGAVFGLAVIVAGGQWYAWNAWHTGDPVFPLLYELLPYHSGVSWNDLQHAHFKEAFAGTEKAVSTNLFWLLAYPLKATFFPAPIFEAGRTGLGILPILALPFTAFGFWRTRHQAKSHFSLIVFTIAVGVYATWFLWGPSQRVRHLLPLLPLGFLVGTVLTAELPAAFRRALAAGAVVVLVVQLGGQAVFSHKYVNVVRGKESRASFLERNVNSFATAQWVNTNLSPAHHRILVPMRQLNYLFDVPIFYGNHQLQAEIEIHRGARLPTFWQQMQQHGVTHLLDNRTDAESTSDIYTRFIRALQNMNCTRLIQSIEVRRFGSRTLPQLEQSAAFDEVYELTPASCTLGRL